MFSANKTELKIRGIRIDSKSTLLIIQLRGMTAKRTAAMNATLLLYLRSVILYIRKVSTTANRPTINRGAAHTPFIELVSPASAFSESGYPIMLNMAASDSQPKYG